MYRTLYWGDPKFKDEIVSILRSDRVVACDSDTVGGLLAQPTEKAFLALNSVKKRKNKPYLLLIGSKERFTEYVDEDQLLQIEKLVRRCWPGPLTLIVKAKKGVPDFLQSSQGTIAFRVPDHAGLLDLLKDFPALFSTSANLAGQPTPVSVQDLDPEIKKQVELIVSDKSKQTKPNLASTILDCSDEQIKIVREGAYSVDELERIQRIQFKKK